MEPESPPRGSTPQGPRLGPTRPATLVVAGLAAAAVAWWIISSFYGSIPDLPWLPTVTLAALAVFEGYVAINTRHRIERRPGREPVDPLAVARYVVLAKASSLAGAIFAGFYAGLLGWLLLERTQAAGDDIPAASGGLVASLGLVGAALWLERSCRVPKRPEDDNESDRSDN
ncbi:DUF3180 domain-containing protein [Phytohabitans kaempferiae]|uniref:DUF3180 domain-containing protein n=1 Tax=Phytohabitans kaempferiae TaxID=1620943 RepID=A0ABV6MFI6_9ACTN